jgi:hypothetical protein
MPRVFNKIYTDGVQSIGRPPDFQRNLERHTNREPTATLRHPDHSAVR